MKIFKNYYKVVLVLFLSIACVSCDSDNGPDDLFNEDPTSRTNAQKEELYNLLQSSEYGWKTTYFTDDTQLGGFGFVFNFTDNKHVTMVSDFSTETLTPNESEYDIITGSTIKLSFSTKNYIHDLSDSNTYPDSDLRGQGYRGDFEFLYYGQDGDDLLFESDRFHVKIRFQKATADDAQKLADGLGTLSDLNQSVYSRLYLRDGGNEEVFDYSFSSARRYATVVNPDEFNREISFGVGLKANSVLIRPAIEANGETIDRLIFDEPNNRFVSSVEANPTVEIVFQDGPFNPSNDYQDFESYVQYGYLGDFDGATNVAPTSADFLQLFGDVRNDLFDATSVSLSRVYLTVDGGNNYLLFVMEDENGTDVTEPYFINYSIDSGAGKIVFSGISWNNDEYAQYLQPLVDMFVQSEGMYFDSLGSTFQGYPKYTFTSAESPNLRVTTLAFE